MSSKIILNHHVIYDKSSGTLSDIEGKKDEIVLTTPANNCLMILLKNRPDITTQKELFEEVWEKYGIPINSNTLYQNVAMIRRAFRQLGIEDDVIVTIPRRGMLIAETVHIAEYVEDVLIAKDNQPLLKDSHPDEPTTENVCFKLNVSGDKRKNNLKKISMLFLCFSLILFVIVVSSNFIYGKYLDTQSRFYNYSYWGTYNQCRIYASDYLINKIKSNNNKPTFNAKLFCNNKERVYVSLYTGLPRESFIICDGDILNKMTNCFSRYRYFIES